MEPQHAKITETLEALAADVHPLQMIKEETEPLWGVELEDGSTFALRHIASQRKLVVSTNLECPAAGADSNWELHEVLLSDAQQGAQSGGVNFGLDEEGIVFFYDVAVSTLSRETLGNAFLSLIYARQRWSEAEIPAGDVNAGEDRPGETPEGMVRV